jgi:hypothetical protein
MSRLRFDVDRSTLTGGEGCLVFGLGCLFVLFLFALAVGFWYLVVLFVANVAFDAGWSSLQVFGVAFLLTLVTGAFSR